MAAPLLDGGVGESDTRGSVAKNSLISGNLKHRSPYAENTEKSLKAGLGSEPQKKATDLHIPGDNEQAEKPTSFQLPDPVITDQPNGSTDLTMTGVSERAASGLQNGAADNKVAPADVTLTAEQTLSSDTEEQQNTNALLAAFQKKQKARAISQQNSDAFISSNGFNDNDYQNEPSSDEIAQELKLAKKHLWASQRRGEDVTEQDIRIRKLENEYRKVQKQEKLFQKQELEEFDDSNDMDGDDLFVSDRPVHTIGKRSLSDRQEVMENPPKRATTSNKRMPAKVAKQKKNGEKPKVQKKGKRMTKKEQKAVHKANLLSSGGSFGSGSLFQNVRDNDGRPDQPTLESHKKSEALKMLIASIPFGDRQEGQNDKTALLDASKVFGQGRCTPQVGTDAWLIKGMKSALSHYQMLGASFMVERERFGERPPKGGILADSMGLGKTVMSLATVVNTQPHTRDGATISTTLIVTPASITLQWLDEVYNHCQVNEKGRKKHGIGLSMRYSKKAIYDQPDPVGYMATHDIIVTTYAEVLGSYPKCQTPVELQTAQEKDAWWRQYYYDHRGPLHQMQWHRIILDEATSIKNHTSWTSKACFALEAEFRWVVSGTPAMNSLSEFYSYFKFLRVPDVGSFKVFKQNFMTDTAQGPERLQAFLKPFMLRRTHESKMFGAKLLNLPPPTRHTLLVHFSELEKQIYEVVRRRFILMINNIARAGEIRRKYSHILTLLLRLRQLAAHPLLIQDSLRDLLQPEDFEELKKITENAPAAHLEQRALIKHLRRMLQSPKELVQLEPGSSNILAPSLDIDGKGDSQSSGDQIPNTGEINHVPKAQQSGELTALKPDQDCSVGGKFGLKSDLSSYIQHFQDEQNDDTANESLDICGRCQEKAKDLHVTSCEHIYCNDCLMILTHEAENNQAKCIVCNTIFSGVQVYETGEQVQRKRPGYSSNLPSKAPTRAGTAQPSQRQKKKASPKEIVETWIDATGNMLPSAKMIAVKSQILNWLSEERKPKMVIYSQFRTIIIILRRMCHIEGWRCIEFHGSMSMTARSNAVKRFESESGLNIMLASLQTGGVGLNLSSASRVLVVDLWWNSAVEEQAFCRTYRRGQQRETYLTRLAVQGTIDVDIVRMQERKEREIESVVTARPKPLTTRELLKLFGPLGEDEDGNEYIHVDDKKLGEGAGHVERGIEEDEDES